MSDRGVTFTGEGRHLCACGQVDLSYPDPTPDDPDHRSTAPGVFIGGISHTPPACVRTGPYRWDAPLQTRGEQ